MKTGKITGTGSYVPSNFMDNFDLSNIVDTNDAWIQERTGIIRRHISTDDTTISMASKAADQAIKNAGISPNDIDLILVATMSPQAVLPCTACEVQKSIQADQATCFDLNAACSGFLYAYNTAQAYIASEVYKTVLVIGTETLSNLVDWKDRGTCILFGDGAGAVVLSATEEGVYSTVTHSDGQKKDALTCDLGSVIKMNGQEIFKFAVKQIPICIQELLEKNHLAVSDITYFDALTCDLGSVIKMNGQEIFKFAVKQIPICIQELLEKNHLAVSDITYFVLHQANKRIIEAVAKRLHVDLEHFPMNLQEYGNTSSASIPILLHEMNEKNMLHRGDKVIMAGFGAGLTWGATLLEW